MNSTSTITVMEMPDGTFVATCGGLTAEGATYSDAEALLRDLLDQQWEATPGIKRPVVAIDPDALPEPDEL